MHRVEKNWHRREAPSFGHLLVEAGMIVFSILLALGIESWREHRAHEKLAETAMRNIRVEIARNRDALRHVLPEHKALVTYLQWISDRLARGEDVQPSTTYRPANLLSAAWDTAGSTQALVYVDFAKVQRLSRLYSGHGWVQRLEGNWLNLTSNPSFRTREGMPRYAENLVRTMSDLVGIEEELAAGCDRVLETL